MNSGSAVEVAGLSCSHPAAADLDPVAAGDLTVPGSVAAGSSGFGLAAAGLTDLGSVVVVEGFPGFGPAAAAGSTEPGSVVVAEDLPGFGLAAGDSTDLDPVVAAVDSRDFGPVVAAVCLSSFGLPAADSAVPGPAGPGGPSDPVVVAVESADFDPAAEVNSVPVSDPYLAAGSVGLGLAAGSKAEVWVSPSAAVLCSVPERGLC